MLFACAAAVAAAASHSPAWFLSGAYHPPLQGRASNNLHSVIGSDDKELGGSEISGEALTVALDVVQAWAVLLTLGFTLIIFFFLAFCVCSKKDDGYDEFEISQGITTVKICHDGGENGVSLIPRLNGSGTESLKATDETSEASSRYTLKRELPAIPTTASGHDMMGRGKSERPVSQHSSDLYASVNESGQGNTSFKLIGGVQVLPAGAIAPGGRAAVVKESVSSPEGDTKADGSLVDKKVSDGKEEKLSFVAPKKSDSSSQVAKAEHPYAKVGATHKGIDARTETVTDSKGPLKDARKRESEGRYESAYVPEPKKQDKFLPLSSHVGDSSKVEKVGGAKAPSPHSAASSVPLHSSSVPAGRSPISPNYRSPTSPPQPEPPAPIPAAMAISGRTPANEEMPYMTPPALQPNRDPNQQHFSGDSQDSRGYTSISVREPLAALKARQAAEGAIAALARGSGKGGPPTQGPEGEGYYMTVSDDSADEMYACIYEGSRGTGSETYAQIEPRLTPSSQVPPSTLSASSLPPASPTGLSGRIPPDPSPPAPPSVDSLRHVVHSRQASASSSASTGMGSPVAEKRGTRSPLPPLPQGDTVLYSPPEPPILPSQPIPKSPPKSIATGADKPTPRSLEEMYAKVLKKHPGHSRGSSSGAVEGTTGEVPTIMGSARRGSGDMGVGKWPSTPPTSKQAQDMTHSLVETRTHDVVSGVNRAKSCDVSSSWGGLVSEERKTKVQMTQNYETISSLYSGSDPGYETVKNGEPPYASVDPTGNYPGYETVQGASDLDSEPGYETLKHKEFEPGYETVAEIANKKAVDLEPGYESVTTTEYEPGYETVSSKKSSDPGYESVLEKEKLDYDPGYEELSHPNHSRTLSETDPNYEQLKFSSRRSSGEGDNNGYETVKKDAVEGTYEVVSGHQPQPQVTSPTIPTIPLYASVKKKESPKKEKPDHGFTPAKTERKNENFNVIETSPVVPEAPLPAPSTPKEVDPASPTEESQDFCAGDVIANTKVMVDIIRKPPLTQQAGVEEAPEETPLKAEARVATKEEPEEQAIKTDVEKEDNQKYQVMDSPEEVELPPPGEDDNHRVSPPTLAQELASLGEESRGLASDASSPGKPGEGEDMQPAVSLTFTEASPPEGSPETSSARSSESSESGAKEAAPSPKEEEAAAAVSAPKEEQEEEVGGVSSVPPEFEDTQPGSPPREDPLPPPPLPALDDDAVTASPPPPPPPIPDEGCNLVDLPPPPLPPPGKEVNGVASPVDAAPGGVEPPLGCFQLPPPELPPPPFSENGEDQASSKAACVNGNITLTVNPMAEMEEDGGEGDALPPPAPLLPCGGETAPASAPPPGAPVPPPIPLAGESVESQSSGSTVNGNGSVESVVTVDPKSGADPATTVPPPGGQSILASPLQHSSSTSSSDSKHSDPNEGITPV